ncbi:MAG: hypothetical protein GY925_06290 [Actinomycetia bacterium]|nr:hypothetical protein [Actinomycetes bacterium]
MTTQHPALGNLAAWMLHTEQVIAELVEGAATLADRVTALEQGNPDPPGVDPGLILEGPIWPPPASYQDQWRWPRGAEFPTPGGRDCAWRSGDAPSWVELDGETRVRARLASADWNPVNGGATGTHDAHLYLPPTRNGPDDEITLEYTAILHDTAEFPWDFGRSGKLAGLFGWHPHAGASNSWDYWAGGHNWHPSGFNARTVWFYTERDTRPDLQPVLGEYVYLGGGDGLTASDIRERTVTPPRQSKLVTVDQGKWGGSRLSWVFPEWEHPPTNTPIRIKRTINTGSGTIMIWIDDVLVLGVHDLPLMTEGPRTVNGVNLSMMFGGARDWGPRNEPESCDVSIGGLSVKVA